MPKYLLQVSYTAEGAKGLLKDGGTKRRAAAKTLVESLGGKIECFYFAFGKDDAVVVADFPDGVSAAAASLTIAASGAVTRPGDRVADARRDRPGGEEIGQVHASRKVACVAGSVGPSQSLLWWQHQWRCI